MSLVVAVPFGVAGAIVYGTSIVVQHRTAQQHADGGGEASAAGLLRLVRSPIWLLAILGDLFGFLLQIAALSAGPVVVIQPLVVLMLPVALAVSYFTGGPSPRRGDYIGCAAVIGGLALFLALIGKPGAEHLPHGRRIGTAVICVLLAGVLACVVVIGRRVVIRGAVYGAVAGAYFGTLGVMVDAASERVSQLGVHGLVATPRGLVMLACAALMGLGGGVLTQMSFQVGALSATLPANLAADPFVAVVLGAVLLREHFPLSPEHLVAYAVSLAAVIAGAIRLAAPVTGPVTHDHEQPT